MNYRKAGILVGCKVGQSVGRFESKSYFLFLGYRVLIFFYILIRHFSQAIFHKAPLLSYTQLPVPGTNLFRIWLIWFIGLTGFIFREGQVVSRCLGP